MKMKKYLSYIYKNNKSLFKRDRGKALQEPIEHWFHQKILWSIAMQILNPPWKHFGETSLVSLYNIFLAQKIGIPITVSFGNKYINTFSQNTNLHPLPEKGIMNWWSILGANLAVYVKIISVLSLWSSSAT